MDSPFLVPWAKTELWLCPCAPGGMGLGQCSHSSRVTLPGPSPHALPADFIFLCFKQHSAAATGKYLAAWHAVVQHTGEKMRLLAGDWVSEQINKKEKWCLWWGDQVKRKIGGQVMEKSVVDSAQLLGKSCPSPLPIYTFPQTPSTTPPNPPSLSVIVRRVLLTLAISIPRV